MKNVDVVMSKAELFAKAEKIIVMKLNDDTWTMIAEVEGQRLEEVLYKTNTEDFEELVGAIKETEPALREKIFEEE